MQCMLTSQAAVSADKPGERSLCSRGAADALQRDSTAPSKLNAVRQIAQAR